ncbi:hypothetical protein ACER0C_019672 [Sarotherodon galilaeus]
MQISINVHVKNLVMLPVSTQQKALSQYIKEVYGTEVLRQELLQLLEDGEEDAAMTFRLLPVQRPDHVCDCPAGNVEVSPGAVVALVTINDSNKRRHRIRKVILDEKKRLAAAVDDYNKLAEPTKPPDKEKASLVGMSEDAQKGLHSLVLKKQSELKAEMLKIKDTYKRILSHQPLLEMDSEEEEDIPDDATESDLSTSDED